MESIDLSADVQTETAVLNMLAPSGRETGWLITLAGPAHRQTIALSEDLAREQIRKEGAIEFAQVNGRKWKTEQESVGDRRRETVTGICRRIVGWAPNPVFAFHSTEPIAFSLDNAVALFLHPEAGYYFGQIAEYLRAETAFTPRSAKK